MQKKGVEPSRYCYHTDLNRARLPIPPLLHIAKVLFFLLFDHSIDYFFAIKHSKSF